MHLEMGHASGTAGVFPRVAEISDGLSIGPGENMLIPGLPSAASLNQFQNPLCHDYDALLTILAVLDSDGTVGEIRQSNLQVFKRLVLPPAVGVINFKHGTEPQPDFATFGSESSVLLVFQEAFPHIARFVKHVKCGNPRNLAGSSFVCQPVRRTQQSEFTVDAAVPRKLACANLPGISRLGFVDADDFLFLPFPDVIVNEGGRDLTCFEVTKRR